MLVMLSSDKCGPCREKKKELKEEINEGKVIPIDIESKAGRELAKAFEISKIPKIIKVGRENQWQA